MSQGGDFRDFGVAGGNVVGTLLRLLAGVVGVVLVAVGLMFVVRLLTGVPEALKDPKSVESLVNQWSDTLGFAEGGLVKVGEDTWPVGRSAAVIVLGGGAAVVGSIALTCITAGAKLLLLAALPGKTR